MTGTPGQVGSGTGVTSQRLAPCEGYVNPVDSHSVGHFLQRRGPQTLAQGANLAHSPFLYNSQAKKGFTFLNACPKSKEEYLCHMKSYAIQIVMSINTVLVAPNQAHRCTDYLWLLLSYNSRVGSL